MILHKLSHDNHSFLHLAHRFVRDDLVKWLLLLSTAVEVLLLLLFLISRPFAIVPHTISLASLDLILLMVQDFGVLAVVGLIEQIFTTWHHK